MQPDYIQWQMKQDEEQLNLIRILFMVMAGLVALMMCVGMFYIILGISIASAPKNADSDAVGVIFPIMGMFVIMLSLAMSGACFYASKCIQERKNWTFVFVVSCILCLNMPLGTALGVFSIIVLNRATVKVAFGESVTPPPIPPAG